MKTGPIAIVLAALATALMAVPSTTAWSAQSAWPQEGHDATHSGYSAAETTISKSNVSSLVLKWDAATGSEVYFPPLEAGSLVYAANDAGQLVALHVADGTEAWTFNTGNPSSVAGGGLTIDRARNMVFVLCVIDSQHAGLCALNAKTGALLWSWAIYTDGGVAVGSSPYNAPVVHGGMVFMGESDTADFSHVGYFVALDETNGALVWQRGNCGNTGNNYCNFLGSNPATVTGGKNSLVIYDTGYEGNPYAAVCAVSEASGALAWCFPALTQNVDDHAPSVANGLVYLAETDANNNSNFFALRAKDGSVKWSYTAANGNGGDRFFPAAIAKGTVYFPAGTSPTVFAFNASKGGAPLWQTSIQGDTGVSVANGLVYGWNDNGTFALDAGTGNQLWGYSTAARNATPFVVNGMLFATCNISDVCAFGLP